MVKEVETNRLIPLYTPLFFGWALSLIWDCCVDTGEHHEFWPVGPFKPLPPFFLVLALSGQSNLMRRSGPFQLLHAENCRKICSIFPAAQIGGRTYIIVIDLIL